MKDRREGQLVELVDDQNLGPETPLRSKRARGGSKDIRRGAMENSMLGSLRGRMSEEMTQSNTFSPRVEEVPFELQRGEDGS